jgi:hypothetical protein
MSVVVLPGPDPALISGTVESVKAQRADGAEVLIVNSSTSAVSLRGDFVAFVRAGDRFLRRKLQRQLAELQRNPEAIFSYTGHRRDGRDVIPPEPAQLSVAHLLLRCPLEASTVMVRTDALPEDAFALLARPGGDAVLWAELARTKVPVRVPEVLSEVRLDLERHGTAPGRRVEELVTIAGSRVCRESPVASAVRRELLARTFLELEQPVRAALLPLPCPGVEAPPPDLREAIVERDLVIEDLLWALERQAERLRAERSTWPRREVLEEERVVERPELLVTERDEIIFRLNEELKWLHRQVAKRHDTIEWLHREVAKRHAATDHLQQEIVTRLDRIEAFQRETDAGNRGLSTWRDTIRLSRPTPPSGASRWARRGLREIRLRVRDSGGASTKTPR